MLSDRNTTPAQNVDLHDLMRKPEYHKVLDEGIRNEADLQRAFELLSALEPTDGAVLARKARELGVSFTFEDQSNFPHAGIGAATSLSEERVMDRTLNQVGENISMNIGDPSKTDSLGPCLIALKHELIHAIPFDQLPEHYRVGFKADKIDEMDNINSIYKGIVSNLMADESIAMLSGILLKQNAEKLGVDLHQYRAFKPTVAMVESQQTEASKPGESIPSFAGLETVLRHDSFYGSSYRILALRIACQKRFGDPTEKIDVHELLGRISQPGEFEGMQVRVIRPELIHNMLTKEVAPILQMIAPSMLLSAAGLVPQLMESVNKLLSADSSQVNEFFHKDMDKLVADIARLIGDEVTPLSENTFQPREDPVVTAQPKEVAPSKAAPVRNVSECTADKVEILGKHVDLMHKLASTTANEVAANMQEYLNLAEHCDPESASQIYSLLISDCANRNLLSNQGKISLAFSLLRSGYEEPGCQMLREVIEGMDLDYEKSITLYGKDVEYLIKNDRQDILARYLERKIQLCDDSMQKFDTWIRDNSASFADYEGGHYYIRRTIFTITAAMQNPEIAGLLRDDIVNSVQQQCDRLWKQLDTWTNNKIQNYARDTARSKSWSSIDALTAVNPQNGGSNNLDDSDILVGLPSNSDQNLNPCEFIMNCLSSSLTLEKGLEYLESFPASHQKLWIYQTVADKLPVGTNDEDRMRLINGLTETLAQVQPGFYAWGHTTRSSYSSLAPEAARSRPRTTFENTTLFQLSKEAQFKLLAGLQDPTGRKRAASLLGQLGTEYTWYKHAADLDTGVTFSTAGYHYFNPALVRAKAFVELAESLDDEDRRLFCKTALLLLGRDIETQDDYGLIQLFVVSKASEIAFKHGDQDNFDLANSVLRDLGTSMPPRPQNDWRLERSWETLESVQKRASTFLQVLEAVKQGDAALGSLITRLERDCQAKRDYFSLEGSIQALSFMNGLKPSPLAQIQDRSLIERLGNTTVDRYIQSIGSNDSERFFTDNWPSLAKAIGEISVEDPIRDRMMWRLIERGTPRGMLATASTEDDSGYELSLMYDGFKALDFVLGNPALPRAEAALLDRLAEQIGEIKFSRLDARVVGAIKGLGWMYKRLADSTTTDKARLPELQTLRDTEEYRYFAQQLFAFSTKHAVLPSLQETTTALLKALKQRTFDQLDDLSPAVHKHLAEIAGVTHDRLRRGPEVGRGGQRMCIIQSDLQGTLFDALFGRLNTAYTKGDRETSQALIKLLTRGAAVDEGMAKVDYYSDLLKNNDVPLEDKRLLFKELSLSKYISRYAASLTEELANRGDIEREEAAMSLALPWKGAYRWVNQNDTLLALVEDSPIEGVRLFKQTYGEFATKNDQGFKFEPTNEYGWEIFAQYYGSFNVDTWPRMMARVGEVMCILRDEMPHFLAEYQSNFYDRYRDQMSRQYLHQAVESMGAHYLAAMEDARDRFNYFDHQRLVSMFSRAPTKQEVNECLSKIQANYSRRERLEDRVNGRLIEIPEIFQDQPALVQFLASRFMLKLSKGERQDLLLAMEDVTENEALLRFFEKAHLEKIGQFLSFWPLVPRETRRELAPLQTDVLASDREEAIEAIDKSGLPGGMASFLIANLSDEPEGSGTIGDVYRSKLPDGTEVAVKVITESKERNFRKGLEAMKKVRDLVAIYGDELENGAEVVRFVDMYIDMVERELDLDNELANYRTAKQLYGEEFGMAEHYISLSREKVLVMKYLPDALKINDPQVPAETARTFMDQVKNHFLFSQVAEHGVCLTDLQPGNIRYLPQDPSKPYLIDFGQQVTLHPGESSKLVAFAIAAQMRDTDTILEFFESISARSPKYTEEKRAEFMEKIKVTLEKADTDTSDLSEYLSEMLQEASIAGLLVRPQFLQVTKGLATVEGTYQEVRGLADAPLLSSTSTT